MTGIRIVYRNIDLMLPAAIVELAQLASERQVETMVIRIAAFVAFAVIYGVSHAIEGVLTVWESHWLPSIVNPVGGQSNTRIKFVATHDNDIVRAVVWGAIFLSLTDSFDSAERA